MTTPPTIQARIDRLSALAASLIEAKAATGSELGKISREVTGLSRREHLHCTGSRELDVLIERFETLMKEGLKG